MRSARVATVGLSLTLLACPSELPEETVSAPSRVEAVKPTGNPRVVELDGELYAKDSPSIAPTGSETKVRSPGTGIPDETNGVCRLYAPKFPDPACCAFETGFDQRLAREICGLDVYLGESQRGSCGYFFTSTRDAKASTFRVAPLAADTPRSAADKHAARLARQTKRELAAQRVPGVAGAWTVSFDNLHWAFLPGWNRVRQLSWTDDSCPSGRVNDLVAEVAAAVEPGPDDAKPMLPTARQKPGAAPTPKPAGATAPGGPAAPTPPIP
jgi:hypothetical protein